MAANCRSYVDEAFWKTSMRIWEVKGYISSKIAPQTRFSTQVHALDRASAVRLVQGQYGATAAQYIQISSIRNIGPSKLTAF